MAGSGGHWRAVRGVIIEPGGETRSAIQIEVRVLDQPGNKVIRYNNEERERERSTMMT